MHRFFGLLLLLLLPLTFLPASLVKSTDQQSPTILDTWNPESLPWSTVLIWSERTSGTVLTTGVIVNKAKRWVLATRHSLRGDTPDQPEKHTTYVVWPASQPGSNEIIQNSDHYFQMRRRNELQPARIIAEDIVRDIVLLEAATPVPEQCREVSLELSTVPAGTRLLGVAQPFTRGGLWHRFEAKIEEHAYRRLSYAPVEQRESVALYVARGEEPAEFGYSGTPLVLPHNGKLVGLLLAAQIDKAQSYVLISSQEIQKLFPIE
jgi:hypothetical protein